MDRKNMEIEERMQEDDFVTYVADLVSNNQLCDSPVCEGIAKQIVAQNGVENLTDRQIDTFINYGINIEGNYLDRCSRCEEVVPWCEMIVAADSGYCSYCQHMMEKDD